MSASLEVEGAPPGKLNLDRAAWIAYLVVFVPTGLVLLAATVLHLPWFFLFALPFALGAAWVVHSPHVGVYALFAGALLIGTQPLNYFASITDIPFWVNLNQGNSLNLSGFGITPAEILMLLILLGLIAKLAVTRTLPPVGRLMWPYMIFGLAVLIGEVNGLSHGGDFKLSLWELRPQVYGLFAFVMATLLIRNPSQVKVLVAILLVGETIKGGEGVFRYFFQIGQELAAKLQENQGHDDSYLLGLFLLAIVIGLIWFRKPVTVLLIVLSPIVFTAIVVNHRRAGILGLGIEIAVAMLFAYIVEPQLRGGLIRAGVVVAVVWVVFLAVFWNQQYGSIAEMVRPIKSLIDPTARDLSSDLYRIAESANLRATYRTSPLIGIGFGHPYYVFYPQLGVAKYDPLWNIIPHNTVLWIPMRMGIVGLVSFWTLISMAIVEAVWAVRATSDRFTRAAVVFALAALLGLVFNGYVDIGLESYRNLVVMGVLLAVISQAVLLGADARRRQKSGAIIRSRTTSGPNAAHVPAGIAASRP